MNVPKRKILGFPPKNRPASQDLNNKTVFRLPVKSSQCNIGTEKYPDATIFQKFDGDDYSQEYGQIEEAFRSLTKDDTV